MRSAIFRLGLCASPTCVAAMPVMERDTPLSFDAEASQLPVAAAYDWTSGYVSEYPIHSSCNATERHELRQGLNEAVLLAQHAKEHSQYS
jgi:hypothetical protein